MKTLITEKFLRKLKARDQDIWDTRCRGLVLRCRASGKHSYRFQAKRGRWFTIGRLDDFTPDEARLEAEKLRGDLARGKDPHLERRAARVTSLRLYLEKEYGPWVRAHRKTGDETIARLESVFSSFLALPLAGITRGLVERWRTERIEAGTKPATVNRDLAALRSALSRAVDFGLMKDHPLGRLKAVKVDTPGIIRYLAPDEEQRLRAALTARDESRREKRARLNEWRESRGYKTLSPHGTYTDHLTPLVLLALNTGLRRGELFGLRWSDVDLDGRRLVVHGEGTKTGQTRIIPLNSEGVAVLSAWRPVQASPAALVFPGRKGEPLTDIKTAWLKLVKRAEIDGFRFHDLRHTFASRLVMASVDLNTVRDLLGHSDLKMTLRYAHLAPQVKASAVEKLVWSAEQ